MVHCFTEILQDGLLRMAREGVLVGVIRPASRTSRVWLHVGGGTFTRDRCLLRFLAAAAAE